MLKTLVNRVVGFAGARIVNAHWGPCGFLPALRKLARTGWAPAQIVDVGAWQGTWTLECRTLFPQARSLMVDPLPENRAALTELSARMPGLTTWSGALGARSGELLLHRHADQSSPLRAVVPEWRAAETITVSMRTLDSFVESGEIQAPQLLKADVQGYELEVVRGAEAVLRSLDAVLLEVSFRELYEGQPLAHDVVGHMASVGFRLFDICSYAQGADGELLQSDFLFVRCDWPAPRGSHG